MGWDDLQAFLRQKNLECAAICDIEIGAYIARFAQIGNIAYRLGRKLDWDGDKQEFVNDAEANSYVKADYRAPWQLPKV